MIPYAVKSTVVLAVAAAVALMLRRRSAAARHLVWTAAVAALLALPPAAWLMPALRLPAAPAGPMAMFRVLVTGQGSAAAPAASRTAGPQTPETEPRSSGAGALAWLPAIWGAGAVLSLLQILAALANLRRLRRIARPFPDDGMGRELGAALGIDHTAEILEAPRGSMPMTCGILRPAVLMPAGAAEWGPERVRVVLLHELAHVRRGDVATHLLGRIALSLNWWNPLVWFAWREFVKERERATDDLVLASGERPSDYAGHLLEIARAFQPARTTAWAALAMARRSQLEGRLVAILDTRVNRRPAGRRAAVASAVAAVALAAPFAAIQAQDGAAPNMNLRVDVQAQAGIAADVEATIRAASAQRNYQMLDQAAARFESLRQFDFARQLLEAALAIRGEVSGTAGAAYAAGLVKLGDLAQTSNRPADADALYAQAVALGDRPEVAEALVRLGLRAQKPGQDSAEAEDYFNRALRVSPSGPDAARATLALAGLREHQPGRESEAATLYQKAVMMEQPALEKAAALERYSLFLLRQNRGGEAQQAQAEANRLRGAENAKLAAGIVLPKDVYRVGNGVTAPRLLYKVEPAYSEEARAAKLQGAVLVYVEITPEGRAANARVVRGLGVGLDEKAIDAIKRWRFAPGAKDGVPVTVAATIEVNFRLL